MENIYKIADHIFKINTLYSFFHHEAKDYLYESKEYDFEINIINEDIENEKKIEVEILDPNLPDYYIEYIVVFRKLMDLLMPLEYFLIHGSCVVVDNKGYLFTAKSGTGKSTHTNNWMKVFKSRAEIINGDKPIIHIENGVTYIYGTPWSGKERLQKNKKAILKNIIYLSRDAQNHIEKMEYKDIYPILYTQLHKNNNPNNIIQIMSLMDKLKESVSFYHLFCNMDISSAITAYKGMNDKLSFEDVLLFENQLVYTAKGISMLPLIKQNHDIITIIKPNREYKKYDAVLFKRSNGQYVLHRIIKVNKKSNDYTIVGDNQYHREYHVTFNQILGLLVNIDKGNKIIDINQKSYKLYVHLWCDFYHIRCLILMFKAFCNKIRRKLKRKK